MPALQHTEVARTSFGTTCSKSLSHVVVTSLTTLRLNIDGSTLRMSVAVLMNTSPGVPPPHLNPWPSSKRSSCSCVGSSSNSPMLRLYTKRTASLYLWVRHKYDQKRPYRKLNLSGRVHRMPHSEQPQSNCCRKHERYSTVRDSPPGRQAVAQLRCATPLQVKHNHNSSHVK